MDSGNSGSIQSSSGGDEEYDSSTNRPDSLLIPQDNNTNFLHPSLGGSSTHFLNNNPLTLSSSSSSNPQQQQQPSLLSHPSLYDPSPSLFLAFSQPPTSSLLNLDSRGGLTRPDPGCTDLGSLATGNASFSSQQVLGGAGLSSDHQTTAATSSQGATAPAQVPGPTRNPKKRTRASRRAPTTVLTTDTSNFRAMVQEFTGIPAPPFSASPYSRTRLDLFGSSTAGSGIIRSSSSHLDPMGYNIGVLNPLRPSPQKFLSPTSNVNTNSATSNSISNSSFNIVDPTSPVGYQLGSTSDHILGLPKQQQQPQSMLNMQNQMLSFQSLVNPLPTGSTLPLHPLGAKSHLASLEELGPLGHGLAGNSWRDGGGSTQDNGSQRVDRLRPFDGSCKLNYSAAASSDHFHHDKGLEGSHNVASRGEGTLDSWICPSD